MPDFLLCAKTMESLLNNEKKNESWRVSVE